MKHSTLSTAALLFMTTLVAALVPTPAFAQLDLAGTWANRLHEDWTDRMPGPDVVDYLGLPLNDQGRARGLSYSAAQLSMPERQCMYYQPFYLNMGPQSFKMWSESEPVTGRLVAWKISGAVDRGGRTIWMDGRPHPSDNALHTFGGFSTGVWQGNTLTVRTTHMKAGYVRRNGVPSSPNTVLTEHFIRHGDVMTVISVVEDPAYLSEHYVLSRNWQLDAVTPVSPYPRQCDPEVEVPGIGSAGTVPHYLPGQNPFTTEVGDLYHLPLDAVLGGPETLYPEYRKKLKDSYSLPGTCSRYCCGWAGNNLPSGLKCTIWTM
ncbi:MAG: hypothetical protein ABUS56_06525 [Acidobacteriota bacterium]